MSDKTRPYRKKHRAELEATTRLRITKSAMKLHGTLGPARTTISAIADDAGVRRSTVYRHFADEAAIFAACSAHWAASHPRPDIETWAEIEDPTERLRIALRELYAFYRAGEQMLANLIRDMDVVPAVQASFGNFRPFLDAAREILTAGRPSRGRPGARTRAAIGHALAFEVWRSLARDQGLDDTEAAELMVRLVAAAR